MLNTSLATAIPFVIHIQIKDEAPTPIKSNNVIGVDFGRRDIATNDPKSPV